MRPSCETWSNRSKNLKLEGTIFEIALTNGRFVHNGFVHFLLPSLFPSPFPDIIPIIIRRIERILPFPGERIKKTRG